MSGWQPAKRLADAPGMAGPDDRRPEGSEQGSTENTVEGPRERFRERARRRLLGAHSRRLFLQVSLPWGAALLVGLVSVLYADSSGVAALPPGGFLKSKPVPPPGA